MQATPGFDHAYSPASLLENQQQFLRDLIIPQLGYIDAMKIGNEQLSLVGWILPWSHRLQSWASKPESIPALGRQPSLAPSLLVPTCNNTNPHAPNDWGFIANFPLPTNLDKSSRIEARGVTSNGLRTTSIVCGTHARSQRLTDHVGD